MSLIWLLWTWQDWDRPVTRYASYLGLLSAPYLLISPFWNISGHVTFTAGPSLFLTWYDRRMAPLLIIPLIMVVNRPFLNAHTWLQSIGGLLLASGVLALFSRYGEGERLSTVQA
ncbi:MAG: hypothetical protein SVU32_07260 [Candidatus Nanohaloarchaea archaeon]|nr:hypothetical protein [Candidatus Nanohaloarchaea archaeon]